MRTNLSALFRSVVSFLLLVCAAPAAYAVGVAPLNPNSFGSLGPNPFTTSGTYTIDTSGTTPILFAPDNSAIATGTVFNSIAVFTFDTVVIGSNTTVQGLRNTGSHPYALLSHGDLTIEGTVDASGAAGGPPGSNGGNGGAAGPGGGGGGGGGADSPSDNPGLGGIGAFSGSPGDTVTPGTGGNGGNAGGAIQGEGKGGGGFNGGGGGAFGGNGGTGEVLVATSAVGIGGRAYLGDLTIVLLAASGGGGGGPFEFEGSTSGAGGGGGGGTVEFACLSNATVSGTVSVNGGNGGSLLGVAGGGGGGGGGILFNVAGNITLLNTARLSAAGGAAGVGGGGGGGLINIIATVIDVQGTGLGSFVNVAGGLVGVGAPGTGSVGIVTVAGTVCPEILTVTNSADSGPGSLRQAILAASACPVHHTINFDPSAYGTITLTSGELLITSDLDILGPGATNVAVNGAGGSVFIVDHATNVTIAGLTITNGSVRDSRLQGGGIDNEYSVLTVSNCTITGNVAPRGGGIANYAFAGSARLTVVNSTFNGNSASVVPASLPNGGAILNDGRGNGGNAVLSVIACTFSGNSAIGGGGAIYNDGSVFGFAMASVIGSTISSNSASEDGGAIYNNTEGQVPGGLATVEVLNSTLSGNMAAGGGGIRNSGDGTTVTIGSTILDAGAAGANITNTGSTITSLGYNLSSDSGGGFLNQSTDLVNTNAMLGPLQLNGGQTPTHALLCGSPAIDAGTNFLGLTSDQRGDGFPRTFGAATDIGAFELQQVCNHPPVALCTDITVSADTNCMATVNAGDIDNGSSDPDPGDSITLSFDASSLVTSTTLPGLGDHSVTLYVTDTHGAQTNCTATVTVKDTTPPTVHCPNSITATNDPGQCSAVVSFSVSATDNCTATPSVTADPSSGSTFAVGTTNVTVTAVDNAGNTNTCSFMVTVVDGEPPQVLCLPAPNPSGKISIPGKNGATGTNPSGYYQLLAKDNCDLNPLIRVKDTGSTFVAGPFHDGDIVQLKHAGGAPSQSPGKAPIVAVISLKGNGLEIARDASGNTTPDASGCLMKVSQNK